MDLKVDLRIFTVVLATWLFATPFAAAQSASHVNPKSTSDQVFKNVQVLKGIPVDDFLGTMGIMCAALGFDCAECHTGAGTEKVDWAARHAKKTDGAQDGSDDGRHQSRKLLGAADGHLLELSSRPRSAGDHA